VTTSAERVLAVVPARGGSKGLPGKNVRPLMGVPLIAHTILMARSCRCIDRLVVSTDSDEIATVARAFGADVPFMRPVQLAQDDTPIWPVLQHALNVIEEAGPRRYDYLLLLDPTSPGRLPEDIEGALAKLRAVPGADGIVGVSRPAFNPIWTCVVERDGWMADLIDAGATYTRRQDVPAAFRINAMLYLWRTAFVRGAATSWRVGARNLLYETPELRSLHIDSPEDFAHAELLLHSGAVRLPWLDLQVSCGPSPT
jgi:CMP-N,N'-diacetyllegionaminic acid synthase